MIVSVIGHGTSPQGKSWGPRIDDSVVVRLWDWHWQGPGDYGRLYHYGYIELSQKPHARFIEHNRCTPMNGWVAGRLKKGDYQVPPNCQEFHPKPYIQKAMEMGGMGTREGKLTFTRGTVIACWVMDVLLKDEKEKEVVLVGFDNTYIGKALSIEGGFPQAYRDLASTGPFKTYTEGMTKYSNHDFAIERPLLEFVANRAGVKLNFAQDVWT